MLFHRYQEPEIISVMFPSHALRIILYALKFRSACSETSPPSHVRQKHIGIDIENYLRYVLRPWGF
jgi:hypothetical protein